VTVVFCAYTGLLNAVTSFALAIFIALKKQKTPIDKRFFFFAFFVGYWGLSYYFGFPLTSMMWRFFLLGMPW